MTGQKCHRELLPRVSHFPPISVFSWSETFGCFPEFCRMWFWEFLPICLPCGRPGLGVFSVPLSLSDSSETSVCQWGFAPYWWICVWLGQCFTSSPHPSLVVPEWVQPSAYIQPRGSQFVCDSRKPLYRCTPNCLFCPDFSNFLLVVLNTMKLLVPYSLYSIKISTVSDDSLRHTCSSPGKFQMQSVLLGRQISLHP